MEAILAKHGGIEPAVLDPLLSLVHSVLPERNELVYLILDQVLSDDQRFSDFTEDAIRGNSHAFRKVLEKNMPKTHRSLRDIGALEDEYLGLMFRDFFRELLSPDQVLHIVDAYLLEGTSALIRFAMGIIFAYKKDIKADKFSSGNELWDLLRKQDAVHRFAAVREYAYHSELSLVSRVVSSRYTLSNKQISALAEEVRTMPSDERRRSRPPSDRLSSEAPKSPSKDGAATPNAAGASEDSLDIAAVQDPVNDTSSPEASREAEGAQDQAQAAELSRGGGSTYADISLEETVASPIHQEPPSETEPKTVPASPEPAVATRYEPVEESPKKAAPVVKTSRCCC